MTTSKMGIGVGSNRVDVAIGVGEEGVAGSVAARENCVAISVGEGSAVDKLRGTHAVQRTRIEKERRDFIIYTYASVFEWIIQRGDVGCT